MFDAWSKTLKHQTGTKYLYCLNHLLALSHTTPPRPCQKRGTSPLREIASAYYKAKHRQLPSKWLDREPYALITVDLLAVDETTKPYRHVLNSFPGQERL